MGGPVLRLVWFELSGDWYYRGKRAGRLALEVSLPTAWTA